MLLLARMSIDDMPPRVADERPDYLNESIAPLPVPPPPAVDQPPAERNLERTLEQQQDATERLEAQVSQQQQIIQNLEEQLQTQVDETRAMAARLDDYQRTVDELSSQQMRLEGVQRSSEQSQTSLVWVGAGLVMVLLVGGGGVLIVLAIWLAQSSRNHPSPAPNNTVIYSPPPAPPVSRYTYYDYEQELLPPTPMRQAVQHYSPQDYHR